MITPTPESLRIVGVAIRDADDKVWSLPKPKRHRDLYMAYSELRTVTVGGLLITRTGQEQGFITSAGHFVGRQSALQIARAAEQLICKPTAPQDGLFSEDVW